MDNVPGPGKGIHHPLEGHDSDRCDAPTSSEQDMKRLSDEQMARLRATGDPEADALVADVCGDDAQAVAALLTNLLGPTARNPANLAPRTCSMIDLPRLMRLIRKGIETDATRGEIWIRRWALVRTVFLAAAAVVIDLITLINYFLGGDLSARFALKVGVVLLVAGGFFMHFLADITGYWTANPHYARMVGWGAFAVVIASIVSGFFIMGSPAQVRLYRFDDQKVSDLENIQYQVVNFWQTKERLPQTLAEMEDPLGGFTAPRDVQTGESYVYEIVKAPRTFKLCATFNAETQEKSPYSADKMPSRPTYPSIMTDLSEHSWQHGAGEQCFERTIDPDKYPPYKK